MTAVETLREKIRNIPTLPAIVIQVIKTTNNPTSSARDLNKIITNDQAIAAKILQMANSSFYGLSAKVNNLNRAITLLGFNTVRSLALSISIVDHFSGKSSSSYFNRGKFWEHSMGVAMLSKMLAEKKGGRLNPEEAYIAGLLHDLGVIILDQFFQDKFSEILKLIYEADINFLEAEETIIGQNHALFGAEIAQAWNYPEILVDATANHHNPTYNGDYVDISNAVYLANILEYRFNDNTDDKRATELDEEILKRFIEDDEQMEILKVKFEAETERNREILKLFH
jgi:putative nucleotidyltransferase with HDIG domain